MGAPSRHRARAAAAVGRARTAMIRACWALKEEGGAAPVAGETPDTAGLLARALEIREALGSLDRALCGIAECPPAALAPYSGPHTEEPDDPRFWQRGEAL